MAWRAAVKQGLPDAYFDSLGLSRLATSPDA
jgi:hypothetical protein